ncbi:MAG: hypothetical protein GC179_19075 [Anaerolineaceae bacterium]|nr:hypothetical protein [Anaerolineaceae bacterium]
MNIQTERLENHNARFTVTLESSQLDQAKQQAARKLSQKYNIPGFRKGKAPYNIVQRFFGEAPILEDAIEILGNDVYKQALDESGVAPYAPGQLEDFKAEPQPTFIFIVPLQPTVDLGDYRSLRMEYTEPVVEDSQLDRVMRQFQEDQALYEESTKPVEMGNRVTMELYAKIVDEEGDTSEAEHTHAEAEEHDHDHAVSEEHDHDHAHAEGEEHDHDHDHEHDHDHGLGGNEFIHEHEAVMVFREENEEPIPGFRQAVIGATVDEERTFELTYPEDEKEYEEYAGKKAEFKVKVKKIENVTLPSMNDELAARITQDEEKPLTLLELRMRTRENLQESTAKQAKSDFAGEALDKMVEGAAIAFPEEMIDDQTESYLERLDQDFRRQGLTLDDYMRIANKTKDEIKADYRDIAIKNLKRALTLREIRLVEAIEIPDSAVEAEIDKMLSQFGEQAASLRGMLDTPQMRENIKNDLLEQSTLDRIVAIAKGEAPALNPPVAEEVTSTSS